MTLRRISKGPTDNLEEPQRQTETDEDPSVIPTRREIDPVNQEFYQELSSNLLKQFGLGRLDDRPRPRAEIRKSGTSDVLQRMFSGREREEDVLQTESRADFEVLVYAHAVESDQGNPEDFIESFRQLGLELEVDDQGSLHTVDWGVFFTNYDALSEIQQQEFLSGITENFTHAQRRQFRRNFRLIERNHRQRRVADRLFSDEEIQAMFGEGTLTDEEVERVAQERAQEDPELAQELERIETITVAINAEAQAEQQAQQQAEEDLTQLASTQDGRSEVLEETLPSHATQLEIATALRSHANVSISDCEIKDGQLSFDAPGAYSPAFADIQITPEGFATKIGGKTTVFPFHELKEAIDGIHAVETLQKEAGVETVLAMNPERLEWVQNTRVASKLFETAQQLSFLLTTDPRSSTPEDLFIKLVTDIGEMGESEFEEFQDIITGVDNIDSIGTNPSVALAIKSSISPEEQESEIA